MVAQQYKTMNLPRPDQGPARFGVKGGEMSTLISGPYIFVAGFCVATNRWIERRYLVEQMRRWLIDDVLIQVAMPDVSLADREWLISGISDDGWAMTFPREDA